ncbi:uncharacterized protein LOC144655877 [Oculina patagonica]
MSHRFPLGDPVEHNDANEYLFHLLGRRNLGNGLYEFLSCVQPMNDDAKTRLQEVMRKTGSCKIHSQRFCWKYPYSEKVKVTLWTGNFKSETEEINRSKIDEPTLPDVYPCKANCKTTQMTVDRIVLVDEENRPFLVTGPVHMDFTVPVLSGETREGVEHDECYFTTRDVTATW